jgi:hypothetical protein
VSQAVLHLDLIAFSHTAPREACAQVTSAAAALASIEGAEAVTAIEGDAGSDFDLALLFFLTGFAALEPFGTDVRYTRFLQGSVAPLLRAFAGADVTLEGTPSQGDGFAACLAVEAPEETYDWEVKAHLAGWGEGLDNTRAILGLAVGERQRYRGISVIFSNTPIVPDWRPDARFSGAIVTGPARRLA